jgi:RNA polymerase sigma factor (sigma-70 family)
VEAMKDTVSHILIAGCLNGNRSDQKELYKAFYGMAFNVCLRYAGNRNDASEIVNQGFLNVFSNLKKYRKDMLFGVWLKNIMVNKAIDYYRKILKLTLQDDPDDAEYLSSNDLPENKIMYEDFLKIIQTLPIVCRIVFNLYAIEGYSHNEISVKLRISHESSKSNLAKARRKLQSKIFELDIKRIKQ